MFIQLDILDEKCGKYYAITLRSWRNNWDELSTYFKYPQELRTIIYTTNAMENYNRMLRKVTKSKSTFPTIQSLNKALYLATTDITSRWSPKVRNWSQILDQLNIHFDEGLTSVIM